jgi:hypothetical protein
VEREIGKEKLCAYGCVCARLGERERAVSLPALILFTCASPLLSLIWALGQ